MARASARDFAKRQRKLDDETLKRASKTIQNEAKTKKAAGHVAGAGEIGDTNVKLLRLARAASDLKRRSRRDSRDYKRFDSYYNKAEKSVNDYRNSSLNQTSTGGRATTSPSFSVPSHALPLTGKGSYYDKLQGLSNARAEKEAKDKRHDYIQAKYNEDNERRAQLYKYGDVDRMSGKEINDKIRKLEQEKAQRQAEREALAGSSSIAGGGVSQILKGAKTLSAAQKDTYDKLDADADDKLMVYRQALPAATLRDEEKKLTRRDKWRIEQVADIVRSNKYAKASDVFNGQANPEVEKEKEARASLEDIRKKGIDVNYLIDTYATLKDNEDAERDRQAYEAFAKENPKTAFVLDVITSPARKIQGGIEALSNYTRSLTSDKPIMVNQQNRWLSGADESITKANKEDIEKIENPIFRKLAGIGYDAVKTVGEMGMDLALSAGVGAAAGAGSKLGSRTYQGLMSAGAAETTYNDALERGLDPNHAMATAVMAGVAEWFTEKVSLDNLKVMAHQKPATYKELFKNITKSMVVEGSEEAASDIMNTISDSIINGKKSEFNINVRQYEKMGLAKGDARKAALYDWIKDTGYDALIGAISGGIMGGGAQALSFKQVQDNFNSYGDMVEAAGQTADVVDYAKKFDDLTKDAKKTAAARYTEKGANKAGKLADAVQEKVEAAIDSATNAVELQDIYTDLTEDAPDIVRANIDSKTLEKVQELTNETEDDTESYILSSLADEAQGSYEQKIEALNEKLETSDMTEAESIAARHAESNSTPISASNEIEDKTPARKVEPKIFGNKDAVLTASMEPVQIDGFENIGTKDVKVKIDGGEDAVSLDDLSFKSKNIELLYDSASKMDDSAAASAMISNYDGKMSVATYYEEFEKAYNMGTVGYSFDTLAKKSPFTIPLSTAKLAYMLGENANEKGYINAFNESDMIERGEAGVKKNEGKVIDERRDTEDLEKSAMDEIDEKLAEKLGVNIRRVDIAKNEKGEFDEAINGYLAPSKGEMVFADVCESEFGVRIHETMEFVEAVDPVAYRSMMQAVLSYAADKADIDSIYNMVMEYREAYREGEGSKTFDEAMGEFVNDAISGVFMNEEGAKDFITWLHSKDITQAQEKSILQTIADIIKSLIEKIKTAFNNPTDAQKVMIDQTADTQAKIRQMFMDAVDRAANKHKEGAQTSEKVAASRAHSIQLQKVKLGDNARKASERVMNEAGISLNTFKKRGLTGEKIIDYAKDKYLDTEEHPHPIFVKSLGKNLRIKKSGIRESFGHGDFVYMNAGYKKLKVAVMEQIEDVIKGASVSKQHVKSHKPGRLFTYLEGIADFDGEKYRVHMDCREVGNELSFHLHRITSELNETAEAEPVSLSSPDNNSITHPGENASEKKNFSLKVDTKGRELTKEQQEFFADSKIRDDEGRLKVMYHGTARADRVGYFFDPKRATSGPMAYFTDNEDIATNYSKDKADTSLDYEDAWKYENQFVIDVDGEEMKLTDYWNKLPLKEKREIEKAAHEITYDWDTYELIRKPGNKNGNGGYDSDPFIRRESKGNALKMLEYAWLESGDLYGEEEQFLDVLKLAGLDNVKYKDPNARIEKVYEVYLNITNPFTTDGINTKFADDIEEWLNENDIEQYEEESANADMWDKRALDPFDWLERLRNDIKNETTHVWTVIPDAITAYLKENGYDGIVDKGGKHGGLEHTVVIPFSSEQIKAVDNQKPTKENPDIRFSRKVDTEGHKLSKEQQDFFKDSKIRDKEGKLRVVFHGTNNTDFNIFDEDFIGSASGDDGFFGRGFYFAYSQGEAAYYGSKRIIPAYINVKNPFDFRAELGKYNGEEAVYGNAPDAVRFMNFAEKFPELAKDETISVARHGSDDIEEISLEEFAKEFKNVIENKKFTYSTVENQLGEEETLVVADEKEGEYEYDGEKQTYKYYGFEQRFYKDAPALDVAYSYLSKSVYSFVDMHSFTSTIVLPRSEEFTEALKEQGYDGVIQSADGDEVVAFYPEQIKSIDNKAPTTNPDIRYSIKVNRKEAEDHAKKAEQHFGTTTKFSHAGYLDINGKLIDFSDGQRYRVRDHREIEEILDMPEDAGYSDSLIQFMNEGNIRMQEYGIDISMMPNEKQEPVLLSFFRKLNGEVTIDFSNEYGDNEDTIDYEEGTPAERILSDIKNFFKQGSLAEQSSVRRFHYSTSINGRMRSLVKDNEHLAKMVEQLGHEFELTGGRKITEKQARSVARSFLKQYNSDYDEDTLTHTISQIYSYLHSEYGNGETALKKMADAARAILENGGDIDEKTRFADLRDYLKTTGISLTERQKAEAVHAYGSYQAFKSALKGKVKLNDNGADLERIWNADLQELAPELFPTDTVSEDMPLMLADLVEAIEPRVIAYGSETAEQGAYDVAMQIYEKLAKLKPEETFADKQIEKANKAGEDAANVYHDILESFRKEIDELHTADLNQAKEDFEQEKKVRIAENTSEMKAILEAKKRTNNVKTMAEWEKRYKKLEAENQRLRLAKDDEVAAIRAKYNQRRLADRDQRHATETKNKIRGLHSKFQRMILKPTETAYVPQNLMTAAVAVCNVVNPGYGEGTKLRKALDEARRAFPKVSEENGILASDFDPRIADEIDELANIFDNKPEGWSIKDASLEELNRIYEAMNGVYESIRMSTKLIREQGEKDARAAGKKWMKELEESKGVHTKLGKLSDKITSSFLNSYREFRKLAGYNDNGEIMETWRELNNGYRQTLQVEMEGNDLLADKMGGSKEVLDMLEKLNKDLVKVPLKFKSGSISPVMITRGMRLSLIMHGMSTANMRHMMLGGIEIPADMKIKDKKKAYEHTRNVTGITYSAIKQMEMELTPAEKKILDAAKELFHNWSGEKINETSNKLYGFERARVNNYFPITVDRDYVATDVQALKFDKTIEGAGFLKERIQSNNPIILDNIMDIADKTIKSTAMFNGLAVPIRNFNKILNTGTYELSDADNLDGGKIVNPDGSTKQFYVPTNSVKKELKEKWGMRARDYIDNLIADLQQGRNSEYTWYDKLRSNYAGAVLTANASVIIKQTSAYPTVAGIVGWGPTLKAMLRGGKNNWLLSKADVELINKYTPLYWYRNKGNNSRDLAEIRDMGTWLDKIPVAGKGIKFTRDLIQKVDIAMVGRFWYAAQYWVNKNTNLKKGSDAYYRKVAEIFNRAVEETQSTNMTMANADIMRNPAGGMKMITMFMGQGLQNFGIVYDNLANMRAKKKMLKEGKVTKVEYTQAKKDFANAVSSQFVSAAVFAGLAIVARGLLHKMNPYRDDKQEVTAENIIYKWLDDMGDNIFGSIPFGSLIYEWTMSAVTGDRYYGQQDIVLGAISDFEGSTLNLVKAITKGEGILDAVSDMAKDGSKLLGVPYENVENVFKGTVNHIADITSGEGFLSYSSDKKNVSQKTWAKYLETAIENHDTEAIEKYIEGIINLGKTEDDVVSALSGLLKERDDVKKAAAAKADGDIDTYESVKTTLTREGYPESAIEKAVNSLNTPKKEKEKPDPEQTKARMKEEGSLYEAVLKTENKKAEYSGNDIAAAVESGKQSSIDAIIKAMIKEKTTQGLSKEDAAKKVKTSVKTALTKVYKAEYNEGSTKEKNEIMKKLSKVKIDNVPIYDSKTFKKWYDDYKKS